MRSLQTLLFLALSGLIPFLCDPVAAQTAADHNSYGSEHYKAREWRLAIDQFERAVGLDPDNRVIRRNLSNAYQAYAGDLAETGAYSAAIRQLESTVQFDPANPQPFIQLGAYYLHEGLVADAIFRLEEAIELAPENVDAHFLLGEAYYKDNDIPPALQHWDWVLAADPERPGLAERIENARREGRVEADFAGRNSRNFNVTYDREAAAALVREVLEVLEDAYREVGRTFGRAYPPTPIQVSLYTVEGFSESTQLDEHVGAVYDGTKIRCPVIDEHGKRLPADELRRRLVHEYVHVVVHHIAKQNVPWWLNEGLAETLSGDLSSRDIRMLQRARETDSLHRLSDISSDQLALQDVASLRLAYTQSHATVRFLKKRFGTRRFATLLKDLAQGDDPELALRRSFRYTYRTLELAVSDYIKNG